MCARDIFKGYCMREQHGLDVCVWAAERSQYGERLKYKETRYYCADNIYPCLDNGFGVGPLDAPEAVGR